MTTKKNIKDSANSIATSLGEPPFTDEEIDIELKNLLDSGMISVVGLDDNGEEIYSITELGEQESLMLSLTDDDKGTVH